MLLHTVFCTCIVWPPLASKAGSCRGAGRSEGARWPRHRQGEAKIHTVDAFSCLPVPPEPIRPNRPEGGPLPPFGSWGSHAHASMQASAFWEPLPPRRRLLLLRTVLCKAFPSAILDVGKAPNPNRPAHRPITQLRRACLATSSSPLPAATPTTPSPTTRSGMISCTPQARHKQKRATPGEKKRPGPENKRWKKIRKNNASMHECHMLRKYRTVQSKYEVLTRYLFPMQFHPPHPPFFFRERGWSGHEVEMQAQARSALPVCCIALNLCRAAKSLRHAL